MTYSPRAFSAAADAPCVGKFRFGDGFVPEMPEFRRPGSDDLGRAILGAGVNDENLVFEVHLLLMQCSEQLIQIILAVIGGNEDGGFDVSHDSVRWPL